MSVSDTAASTAAQLLLVDDDRLLLALFAKGLQQAGYQVRVASSARQALALIDQQRPDLALLDIRLAGVSGVQLALQLRRQGEVPFLFLSAYSDAETVREATAAGAVGYLVKPIEIAQLVPAVEAGLARALEIRRLAEAEAHLSQALQASRDVSVAIGIVMERYRLDQAAAFQRLRDLARRQRRSLALVVKDLLEAHATLGELSR